MREFPTLWGGARRSKLDDQLQAVQTRNPAFLEDRGGDEPNPAIFSNCGANFHIERESTFVPDRMRTEVVHLRARFFAIIANRLRTAHQSPARKPENVVDAAGPGERIVGQVAFPATGMMQSKLTHPGRCDQIRYGAIENMAKLEAARLFP